MSARVPGEGRPSDRLARGGRMTALALLAAALAPAACRQQAAPPAGVAEDASRQKLRGFWQALHSATEARLRGDCAAAVPLYESALEHDARHEDALYYLGQCRRGLGRPAEARASFARLVEVNPASARGHLALGALLASPDAAEPMDLRAAEAHLRRAHAINGEETGPVVRLGEVLLVAGRAADAAGLLEAALRTNPKSVEAAFLLGLARDDTGARAAARVREAARVEAPVKGVLNEGDRKGEQHRLAVPPLASPLGKLLFAEPISRLRARAAAGESLGDDVLASLWRDAAKLRRELADRSRRG